MRVGRCWMFSCGVSLFWDHGCCVSFFICHLIAYGFPKTFQAFMSAVTGALRVLKVAEHLLLTPVQTDFGRIGVSSALHGSTSPPPLLEQQQQYCNKCHWYYRYCSCLRYSYSYVYHYDGYCDDDYYNDDSATYCLPSSCQNSVFCCVF